jgi:hypothetical protein
MCPRGLSDGPYELLEGRDTTKEPEIEDLRHPGGGKAVPATAALRLETPSV